VEAAAVAARGLALFGCVVLAGWSGPGAVPAFGLAQLAYAVVYTSGLFLVIGREARRARPTIPARSLADALPTYLFCGRRGTGPPRPAAAAAADPRPVDGPAAALAARLSRVGRIDAGDARMALELTLQSVWKGLLTNAERLALVALADLAQQGQFGLVAGLGSLALRLFFFPVEEQAGVVFGQLGGRRRPRAERAGTSPQPIATAGSRPARALTEAQRVDVVDVLECAGRTTLLVGLVALAFGPAYAFLAVDLVYGPRWSRGDAPRLLALYCPNLVAMALNGVLEALFRGLATPAEVRAYNAWLLASVLVHVGACVALVEGLGWGPEALILASVLSMATRIAHCARFARTSLAPGTFDVRAPPGPGLAAFLPSAATATALAAAAAATSASARHFGLAFWAPAVQSRTPHGGGAWGFGNFGGGASDGVRSKAERAALHVGVGTACLALVLTTAFRSETRLRRQVDRVRRLKAE
jgi:hypothetical protein